jgi:hypothetical protein
MKIKFLLFGEAVNIPKTSIGLGVGFVSVWVDGNGFTCASNDLGSLGYILLETPECDVGEVDADQQRLFSNLHARVVQFDIKPNLFAKSGGTARIAMTTAEQKSGALAEKKIEFLAEDCTGVSVVSNALSFSATMLQMEKRLADMGGDTIVSDDDVVAIADAAPASDSTSDSEGEPSDAVA